jgi:hypothetical protein
MLKPSGLRDGMRDVVAVDAADSRARQRGPVGVSARSDFDPGVGHFGLAIPYRTRPNGSVPGHRYQTVVPNLCVDGCDCAREDAP